MNIAAKDVFQDRWVKRSCSVSRVQKTLTTLYGVYFQEKSNPVEAVSLANWCSTEPSPGSLECPVHGKTMKAKNPQLGQTNSSRSFLGAIAFGEMKANL